MALHRYPARLRHQVDTLPRGVLRVDGKAYHAVRTHLHQRARVVYAQEARAARLHLYLRPRLLAARQRVAANRPAAYLRARGHGQLARGDIQRGDVLGGHNACLDVERLAVEGEAVRGLNHGGLDGCLRRVVFRCWRPVGGDVAFFELQRINTNCSTYSMFKSSIRS